MVFWGVGASGVFFCSFNFWLGVSQESVTLGGLAAVLSGCPGLSGALSVDLYLVGALVW